jgi:acyl dehydratase
MSATRPEPGSVLKDTEYVLREYWVRMVEDAMAERGVRAPGEDLNPIFAYLVVLDALDLATFFPTITGSAVDEGLLNGEVEVERRSARGLRYGERYHVRVRLASVEAKHGRTLGNFEIVTIEATIDGLDAPCEFVVRNRILFLQGGAEASPPSERHPHRPSELPPLEIESISAEGAKLVVALTRDPSPLHWDDDMVRALGLGERSINPGSNNVAYVLQMVRSWAGDYGRITALHVRFLRRVHVADHVVAGARASGEEVRAWLDRVEADGAEPVLEATIRLTATANTSGRRSPR